MQTIREAKRTLTGQPKSQVRPSEIFVAFAGDVFDEPKYNADLIVRPGRLTYSFCKGWRLWVCAAVLFSSFTLFPVTFPTHNEALRRRPQRRRRRRRCACYPAQGVLSGLGRRLRRGARGRAGGASRLSPRLTPPSPRSQRSRRSAPANETCGGRPTPPWLTPRPRRDWLLRTTRRCCASTQPCASRARLPLAPHLIMPAFPPLNVKKSSPTRHLTTSARPPHRPPPACASG